MSAPNPTQMIHAYRHLYRGLLHAVQFSKPARYLARDQLRNAFRKEDPSTFDQQRVDRTVEFLEYAAQETGLEHRIVKSLLHTRYWETKEWYSLGRGSRSIIKKKVGKIHRTHYEMTLAMLNDSMGLCLR